MPGEQYHRDCRKRKVQFSPSVIEWSCMSSHGVNAAKYKTILQIELLLIIENRWRSVLYQQNSNIMTVKIYIPVLE